MARRRSSRAPVALLLGGGLVLLLAAFQLATALTDDDDGPASQAAEPGELCVGTPCRTNADAGQARGYEVPSIAVDPDDPDHQVVGQMNLVGGSCGWSVTFDGGKTWEDHKFDIPAEFSRCRLDSAGFLPMGNVAMGASGDTVHAVLTGTRSEDAGGGILLVSSTDGGRTFSTAREILAGGGRQLSYAHAQLVVSTDPQGVDRLLISAWGCAPGRCTKGFFLRSDDGGQTFTAPALVTPDPGGNSPSAPAMAADGTVYMTFIRRYDGGDSELLVARSTDNGATWENGVIDKQAAIGVQYDSAKIVVDPKRGFLYMVYADQRDGRSEVFFRRSQDGGDTWERAVRLKTSPGGSSFSPAIAVAPDGRIEVVFYRAQRKDLDDVHATYSTDGGATFAEDVKLNDRPINREIGYWNEVGDDSLPAVAATNAGAFFAWSDSRNGTEATNTQEILTKRVERPSAA